jgi:hypothetical protein
LNQPIRNKNCLWWPCLLMDRDGMSNLYKGHSIDASYQVSVPLAINWITDKYASKTPQPNEPKLGRKHLWKALIAHFLPIR